MTAQTITAAPARQVTPHEGRCTCQRGLVSRRPWVMRRTRRGDCDVYCPACGTLFQTRMALGRTGGGVIPDLGDFTEYVIRQELASGRCTPQQAAHDLLHWCGVRLNGERVRYKALRRAVRGAERWIRWRHLGPVRIEILCPAGSEVGYHATFMRPRLSDHERPLMAQTQDEADNEALEIARTLLPAHNG